MNKVEVKKAIKNLRGTTSSVNINNWKVSYNRFGDIYVAEKDNKRVLRKNEVILADILTAN
jgi:hypothetical protein